MVYPKRGAFSCKTNHFFGGGVEEYFIYNLYNNGHKQSKGLSTMWFTTTILVDLSGTIDHNQVQLGGTQCSNNPK
jgi:hypothetical protein